MGLLVAGHWALAAPQFPTLTGRVVDNAELLSTSEHERLTRLLEQHESATTNQVVVVTLKSLQGYAIEEFGYQLGRHWGIGQKGKDNGVILIVASDERKVRIEVGYGLEGTLTDALSRDIIENRILAAFKQDNYEAGIAQGTEAILAVIRGTYQPAKRSSGSRKGGDFRLLMFLGVFILGFTVISLFSAFLSRGASGNSGRDSYDSGDAGRGHGFSVCSGGFGASGGFAGGGGFGGGGASGGW